MTKFDHIMQNIGETKTAIGFVDKKIDKFNGQFKDLSKEVAELRETIHQLPCTEHAGTVEALSNKVKKMCNEKADSIMWKRDLTRSLLAAGFGAAVATLIGVIC